MYLAKLKSVPIQSACCLCCAPKNISKIRGQDVFLLGMVPDNAPGIQFEIGNKIPLPSAASFLVKEFCARVAFFNLQEARALSSSRALYSSAPQHSGFEVLMQILLLWSQGSRFLSNVQSQDSFAIRSCVRALLKSVLLQERGARAVLDRRQWKIIRGEAPTTGLVQAVVTMSWKSSTRV